MRNPNDLQNIMHNKSKKREIRKCDTKKYSFENEKNSGMFKMKHQKNAPDVLMEEDLSLDHLFGANVKTHFDHKCRNENLIQHEMQIVEGNKDSNTVDFDCNRQCYKQVYQEMRNPNDLQNIMHNKSKKKRD
ncbi:hypothetical protein CEXT_347491 [Caerostris extrusa]|uniref:Uncharacterized protein n=1 Tax=Caerostris extrusa TaxID=172846 RepID=A0AAV4UX46_CAEEX|nr:hypothetical protein CEXT_347491 [Caerostris extrusa]